MSGFKTQKQTNLCRQKRNLVKRTERTERRKSSLQEARTWDSSRIQDQGQLRSLGPRTAPESRTWDSSGI